MNTAHLIKLYTIYFVLTVVLLGAVTFALTTFFDLELGGSLGIITMILPAMLVGQRYAKRWEARPANGYAWRITGIFTAINFALGVIVGALVVSFTVGWQEVSEIIGGIPLSYAVGIGVVLFLVYWAAGRFFFGFGAKTQLKSMAEQAARAQDGSNQR